MKESKLESLKPTSQWNVRLRINRDFAIIVAFEQRVDTERSLIREIYKWIYFYLSWRSATETQIFHSSYSISYIFSETIVDRGNLEVAILRIRRDGLQRDHDLWLQQLWIQPRLLPLKLTWQSIITGRYVSNCRDDLPHKFKYSIRVRASHIYFIKIAKWLRIMNYQIE